MILEVMNVTSQVVLPLIEVEKDSDVAKFQIDLKNVPAGVYWLKVSHETGTGVLPFVVE